MLKAGSFVLAPFRVSLNPVVERRALGRVGARHTVSADTGRVLHDPSQSAVDRHGLVWVEYHDSLGTLRQLCHVSEVDEYVPTVAV